MCRPNACDVHGQPPSRVRWFPRRVGPRPVARGLTQVLPFCCAPHLLCSYLPTSIPPQLQVQRESLAGRALSANDRTAQHQSISRLSPAWTSPERSSSGQAQQSFTALPPWSPGLKVANMTTPGHRDGGRAREARLFFAGHETRHDQLNFVRNDGGRARAEIICAGRALAEIAATGLASPFWSTFDKVRGKEISLQVEPWPKREEYIVSRVSRVCE